MTSAQVKRGARGEIVNCLEALRDLINDAMDANKAEDDGMVNVHSLAIERTANELMQQSMRATTARMIEWGTSPEL